MAWSICHSYEEYQFAYWTWDYYLEDGTIAVWFTEDWEIYSPGAGSPMGIFAAYNQTQAMLDWFGNFVSWGNYSPFGQYAPLHQYTLSAGTVVDISGSKYYLKSNDDKIDSSDQLITVTGTQNNIIEQSINMTGNNYYYGYGSLSTFSQSGTGQSQSTGSIINS